YADSTWITATRRSLECRAAALEPVLQRLGLSTLGACPLFRLAKTPNAGDLFGALAQQQILTRPFSGHPELLRFGVPRDDVALERLDAALGNACRRG
ncbi:MAG: hypothetical protein B7Y31_12845, partial [Novosphingobium sp. 16-62-11]